MGKAVLIGAGTGPIGPATAAAFSALGADVYVNETPDGLDGTLDRIAAHHDRVHVFVPAAAVVAPTRSLDDYAWEALIANVGALAWPIARDTLRIRARFGRPPRHVVGVSSTANLRLHPHGDLAAAAEAMLESLARSLAHRLAAEDTQINVVCPRWVVGDPTLDGLDTTLAAWPSPQPWVRPESVADVIVTLCCGLMDAMQGQTVVLDHGEIFTDNLMRLHDEFGRTIPAGDPHDP